MLVSSSTSRAHRSWWRWDSISPEEGENGSRGKLYHHQTPALEELDSYSPAGSVISKHLTFLLCSQALGKSLPAGLTLRQIFHLFHPLKQVNTQALLYWPHAGSCWISSDMLLCVCLLVKNLVNRPKTSQQTHWTFHRFCPSNDASCSSTKGNLKLIVAIP